MRDPLKLHIGSLDETRRISSEAFSRTWRQWRTRPDKAYFRQSIFASMAAWRWWRMAWLEIAVYKMIALPAELLLSKYHSHKQLLPRKMANRFIPYVLPKPTSKNHSNKPLCKNVPKELSTIGMNQQIERNLSPIRVPIVDSDLPSQKVNRDDGIIAERSLMEIYRSGDNGNEDVDNNYFSTIPELVSSTFRKDKPVEQGLTTGLTSQAVVKPTKLGLSRGRVIGAVGKPPLDEGGHSIGPNKLVAGLHPGDSQDKPILVGEDESDDNGSETGVSNSSADSTKVNTGLDSRQTSIDTTISSSSIPQSPKGVQRPLKRKIRHTPGRSLSDLYEIQDSTAYSDGESEVESEVDFDDRPATKKRKADDSFLNRLKSRLKKGRTEQDELPTAHDPGREGTEDCGDAYDEAIALTATGDGELDRQNPADIRAGEDSDITAMPQSRRNDGSRSPPTTPAAAATVPQESVTAIEGQPATLARSASVISELNDHGKPQLEADGKQEWEIRDVIGKEVVGGEVHYLVEWSATLVPKYELGTAKALVEKFEARLRAQCKQSGGKRRGRLPPSKAGKQAIGGARTVGKMQQKKRRGRPRKQA